MSHSLNKDRGARTAGITQASLAIISSLGAEDVSSGRRLIQSMKEHAAKAFPKADINAMTVPSTNHGYKHVAGRPQGGGGKTNLGAFNNNNNANLDLLHRLNFEFNTVGLKEAGDPASSPSQTDDSDDRDDMDGDDEYGTSGP